MELEITVPVGTTIASDPTIRNLIIEIEKKNRLLSEKMKAIQKNCNHSIEKEFEKERDIFSKRLLLSKFCTKCGITEKRPKGTLWEICGTCWSSMEPSGKIPAQGGDGQHAYECIECGNKDTHT